MKKSSHRTALSPFKRYWWVAIPAFLASFGGAALYLAFTPRIYEAVVRLSVEDERTSVSDLGQTLTEAEELGGSNPIVTQAEVVKSQGVLRSAIELYREKAGLPASPAAAGATSQSLPSPAVSPAPSPAPSAQLPAADGSGANANPQAANSAATPSVEMLMQSLQVNIVPATNILEVSYRGENAQQAADIVNAVAQAAVNQNVESINLEAGTIREFLESQLPALQSKLRQAELSESQYRQSNGLLAVDAQNQQMVGGLAALEQEERSLLSALREVSTRDQRLQDVTGITSPEAAYAITRVGQDPQLQTLRSQITNISVVLAEARSKLGDQHPELLALGDQLRSLQSLYQQRLSQLAPGEFGNVAAALSSNELSQQLMAQSITSSIEEEAISGRLAVVQANLAQMRNQLTAQPAIQQPLAVLSRERQEAADSLELIRKKLEEARIAEAQLVSNVRVVGLAEPSILPLSPKPLPILALAAVAGSILSIGAILLTDLLDASLQSGDEVEKLVKLPVLGYLPRLSAELVDIEGLDAFLDSPRHVEPYRALLKTMESRQRVRAAAQRNGSAAAAQDPPVGAGRSPAITPQVVVISSPIHNEGKSAVATCLGAVSAMLGRRTLIIEADPHSPLQHIYLQVESQPGLTDVIANNQPLSEAVKFTTIGRLSVLPYGHTLNRPSTVTESAAMQILLDSLEYDLILIDTAPIETSADAITVSQMTDGLLLVTRPGYTPRSVLAETVEQLRKSGAPLIGIAMNETTLPEEQLVRPPQQATGTTAIPSRS